MTMAKLGQGHRDYGQLGTGSHGGAQLGMPGIGLVWDGVLVTMAMVRHSWPCLIWDWSGTGCW